MKYLFKYSIHNYPIKLINSSIFKLANIALTASTLAFFINLPAQAEGSKELISGGGDRPYLEWSTGTTANITRQTRLKVYVQSGETIYLGSSVHNSFDGEDIVLRTPSGVKTVFDVRTSGECFIDTLAKEQAGPLPNAGGYDNSCQLPATETGIYEVEFHAPNENSGDPDPISTTTQFSTGNDQGMTVAAWDITVRDAGGTTKTGRVFTNYVAMNMGSNGRSLNSNFFIQTKDGFRYRTEMNGVDPYGFIFFANSRGFIDQTDNSTVYRSVDAGDGNRDLDPFLGNIQVQRPDVPDTATDITHLVFLNRPDEDTLIHLGIPTTPLIPATPVNFKFTGGNGGSGNQTFVGVGGKFSFDSASDGSYEIIIDTNNDGVFDPSQDRVLQNVAFTGSNVVIWDGKDANGVDLEPLDGNVPYNAQATLRAGEYHFPMLDAENNPNGFVIEMENPPGSFPPGINSYTVYYNDENYTSTNGTFVDLSGPGTPSSPRNAATGIDSSTGTGVHEFSNDYGNYKGIDTWAYFPSSAVTTPLVITTSNQANVQGRKSVRFLTDTDSSNTVTVGDTVEYEITYSNLAPGNSDATNFIINDDLPSQLTFVSSEIVSQTSGNNITENTAYSGSGAVTNSGTLRVGDTITIKITATINDANSGQPISNQARATFNTPDNSATTGEVFTDASSGGATSNPPSVGNFFLQTDDDGENIGNDPANTGDDDPTLLTVDTTGIPQVILVKRITAINTDTFTQFVDDTSSANDNHPQWAANFLAGKIDGGLVRPGDEIEYTIYYLSAGDTTANKVWICDRIPENTTFIPTSFNNLTPIASGGFSVADRGISWLNNGTQASLTNTEDGDAAQYFPPGTDPQTSFPDVNCGGTNTNGAIVVNLGDLNNATAPGTPNSSYGFIRFRGRVR